MPPTITAQRAISCAAIIATVPLTAAADAFQPLCDHAVEFLFSLRLCSVLCCSLVRHLFCLFL